jgi:hypothetical protein
MEPSIILNTTWDIIKNWWWVVAPFILYRPFLFFWLYGRREKWNLSQKSVLLEIKMPKEVLKPLRAMEQVFSSIWGNVFDPADWWEKWFEGKDLLSVQLEMVSLGGVPHFYIRCHEARRNAIESSIYSQYPDAEITIVDDYTKYVPQDLPNKDWDMWGTDYELIKDDVYPIKTYPKFFEEKPEVAKEEKRIDPVATLLEGMGTIGPGEQLWIQIVAQPIISSKRDSEGGYDFVAHGREVADKLAKRQEKAKPKSIFREAAETVITGKVPGAEDKGELKKIEALLPPEARLTPGEKDIVQGVEGKIAKRCFKSHIRFIYLAKGDVYFGGAKAVPFGFFNQFATENLNAPKPWPKTITKIHRYPVLDLVRARRVFIRKRKLFFRYIKRMPPLFPRSTPKKARFILNIEELATIFHFPGRMVAPAPFVPRVESKRGEAPPGLPTG